VAMAALLACGPPAESPPGRPSVAYHATPPARPGGTALLTDFEYPETLAPLNARTDLELRLGNLLFAPLWGYDDRLRPYPDLARRVPTPANGGVHRSADGRSTLVDVQLVPGLHWSDGAPLTAADVVFTWEAMADPATGATLPLGAERVRRVERRSDTELVLTLDGAGAPYLPLGAGLAVMPAHRLRSLPFGSWSRDAFFQRPDVTSGPFVVSEAVTGDRVVFDANPHYADGRVRAGAYPGADGPFAHAPYLERVVFQARAGKDALLRALRWQGADVGFHLLPGDLAELRTVTGGRPVVTTGLRDEFLNPNHADGPTRPWTGDPRVLQALDLALDRTAIVRDAMDGAGRPARGIYPRALEGGGALLPAGADLSSARRLLDAAGWRTGVDGVRARGGRRLEFSLLGVCGQTPADRELTLVRQQWVALGAAVTAGCEERDAFFERSARGDFDMTLYSSEWAPDRSAWAAVGVSGRPENWNHCQDRALDQAFAHGAYGDAERAWLRYRCTIPIVEVPEIRQVSPRLRNFAPSPGPGGDTWNAADWWLA
jgi:peptide/nickel transport system substrate-binding protein